MTMNKFNESVQIEETTAYQESEVMNELNNELENKIKNLKRASIWNQQVLTLDESNEGKWQVTIHEYYAPVSDRTFSVNYVATFHNHTNGGMHQELFPLLKSAGAFLLTKIDKYYEDNPNHEEDAIDTRAVCAWTTGAEG